MAPANKTAVHKTLRDAGEILIRTWPKPQLAFYPSTCFKAIMIPRIKGR